MTDKGRRREISVWGNSSRRHASLETDGDTLIKVSHDFQPSTAISRIAGFHTFHSEVLVHRAMRGTAVGLVLSSIELDQPWFVPAILKKWVVTRQKEFDDAKKMQQNQRKAASKQIASKMSGLSKEERSKLEFEMKEAQLLADNAVLHAGQELREAQEAVQTAEGRLFDLFGPRVWFYTCEGLFYSGEKLLASTGITFGDGDRVKLDCSGHELSVWINGEKVPGISATIATRVFFAVSLQNKGASVQIIDSSYTELEYLCMGKSIEDVQEDENEIQGTESAPPHVSLPSKTSPKDVLASVAVLAAKLMDRWVIVDQAFRALDANGDGMISRYEFTSVMSQFGITEEELGRPIDDVWSYLDSDMSGK